MEPKNKFLIIAIVFVIAILAVVFINAKEGTPAYEIMHGGDYILSTTYTLEDGTVLHGCTDDITVGNGNRCITIRCSDAEYVCQTNVKIETKTVLVKDVKP